MAIINPDTWQANLSVPAGSFIRPTSDNGFVYYAKTGGLTGTSEPTWPTQNGQSVVDNEVTWIAMKNRADFDMIRPALEYLQNHGNQMTVLFKNPSNFYQATNPPEWAASTTYNVGDAVRPVTRNGYVYVCKTAGTSGTEEPAWPTTPGQTVTDNTVEWECFENFTLCAVDMAPGDYTIEETDDGGLQIKTATKTDILVYREGQGNYGAIVDTTNKKLLYVFLPNTPQNFVEGALARITEVIYEINLPGVCE